MTTPSEFAELERLREEHRAVREAMPGVWNAFFARFGSLRPVQLAVMPRLLAGDDLIVVAPTASGKTEAVMAPMCERVVRNRWPGLSVLLVTPTRALVNDLFVRLSGPCDQAGVCLGRKTGDHPLTSVTSPQVLITTPESTESLLTFRRETLDDLRAIVLDEVHLLDGTPRGDQLRLLLQRLRKYLAHRRGGDDTEGLQRVALSATIPHPERTAAVYLGERAAVIQVPGQRELDATVILALGDEIERGRRTMDVVASFGDVRKVLVFVNSRRQVDAAPDYYRHEAFPGLPIFGHHGSLSKDQREDVEARFKAEQRAICVATMTLEVGIDIGDVDLVVCVDPPPNLASFLQRIGRGCRRLQGRTRVVCVARDRSGELIFEALIRQAGSGLPPESAVCPPRRSVLVQQVLAYLRQVDKRRRTVEQFRSVFTTEAYPQVGPDLVEEVLVDMVSSGLLVCRNGVYEASSQGAEFTEGSGIYANIAQEIGGISLIDADSGNVVATIAGLGPGTRGVRVAGRSFDLLPSDTPGERKVRTGGAHTAEVRYATGGRRGPSLAADVGAALRNHFVSDPRALLLLPRGGVIAVFTWLGALANLCLAEGLRLLGAAVEERSLALLLTARPLEVVPLLQRAIAALERENPLHDHAVERLVDLGPHFRELTDEGQARARADWLDTTFLSGWVGSIERVEVLDPTAPNIADLVTLLEI